MEHMLASKITAWCLKRNEMSEAQAIAVTYGIELIFDSLFKVIGLLVLGLIFNRIVEVIIAVACFSSLRSCAGGIHMKSSLGCFLSMVTVCVLTCLGAELINYLPFGILMIFSIGIISLLGLYAPFFTQNNPIEDEKIIKRKKTGAVVLAIIILGAIWLVPVWKVKMLMLIPITIETMSILPFWRKGEKNNGNEKTATGNSTEN